MKNIAASFFFLALLTLTSYGQESKQENEKKKPKATYQVGASKVTVWENTNYNGTTWKNFKVEKVYKMGDEWKTANTFDETELLELKAAIEKAILEESVKTKAVNKD